MYSDKVIGIEKRIESLRFQLKSVKKEDRSSVMDKIRELKSDLTRQMNLEKEDLFDLVDVGIELRSGDTYMTVIKSNKSTYSIEYNWTDHGIVAKHYENKMTFINRIESLDKGRFNCLLRISRREKTLNKILK